MKLLPLILLLVVQYGSIVPCCGPEWDIEHGCADAISDNCCTPSAEKDKEHEEHTGCSPFFTCSTCGGFDFENSVFKKEIPAAYPPYSISVYCMMVSDGFYNSRWQPPRNEWI